MTRTREQESAYQKAYRAANRERLHAQGRAYYVAHREELCEKARVWHAANRERSMTKSRSYYAAHREEIGRQHRTYRAMHPSDPAAKAKKYQARSGIPWETVVPWLKSNDRTCWICGEIGATELDHDHETKRIRGWAHEVCNLIEGQVSHSPDPRCLLHTLLLAYPGTGG